MRVRDHTQLFTLPLVGRAGVGVSPSSNIEKEFFTKPIIPSDPHPNPPHKGEGTFFLNPSPSPCGEGRAGGRSVTDQFARTLRNNATPAERILWQELRLLKSEGRHFRRQVRLAGYVADFACHYPKLVIELDGGQHGDAIEYDTQRTIALNKEGYEVLRFWNNDVLEALEGVVDRIRHAAKLPTAFTYEHLSTKRLPPKPSPQGRGS